MDERMNGWVYKKDLSISINLSISMYRFKIVGKSTDLRPSDTDPANKRKFSLFFLEKT